MPSEWAMKKANAICDTSGFDEGCLEECVSAIAKALDAARIEGLEEALRIGKENMYSICAFKDIRWRIEEVKR